MIKREITFFLFKKFCRVGKLLFLNKNKGFSIVEALIAMGIASIVISSSLGVVGNIYFSQKKVQFTQNFYAEARFMMERIAQIAQNNTIDYDRSFEVYGPDSIECADFSSEQIPEEYVPSHDYENIAANRSLFTYPIIFYWDTNEDDIQDRNLGGMTLDGSVEDPCAEAWNSSMTIDELYLINGDRTIRTAIKRKVTLPVANLEVDNRIELETQLGADIDGDDIADIWGPVDNNDNGTFEIDGIEQDIEVSFNDVTGLCELTYWDTTIVSEVSLSVLGDTSSKEFCNKAHLFTPISPRAMNVRNLSFQPSPNRDPFLNFRVKSAQIHPHVFISTSIKLFQPLDYGFDDDDSIPKISFQTSVSSRVFGNNRK